MTSFYGTQTYTVDHKGRLSIPATMRRAASARRPINEFILVYGLDGCLWLHTLEQWEAVEERLKKLSIGSRKGRTFTRAFLMDACRVTVDKQGRISIPPALIHRAGLGKEAVLHGQVGRIEIWDPERLKAGTAAAMDDVEGLAEEVLGGI